MHKLFYLQKKFGELPLQQSKEWIEGRKYSFGGSEFYKFSKQCDRKIIEERIHEKLIAIENFSGNDCTNWGIMFEPVAKIVLNMIEKIEIHEFGALPHTYLPICYSPDGLIVDGDDLHLLEIKCPIYRSKLDNPIKNEYLDQMHIGMITFPVIDCYFYEFIFRRCKLYHKNNDEYYDRGYHQKESKKRFAPRTPILCGYLIWDVELESKEYLDLGEVENIFDVLKYYDCLKIKPYIQIGGYIKQKGLILKWKLFEYKKRIVKNEDNIEWINNYSRFIWDYYKILYETTQKK